MWRSDTDIQDWKAIITDWAESGSTQKAYCDQHHIKFHNFIYYRKKYRPAKKITKKLLPVRLSPDRTTVQSASEPYQLKLRNGAVLSIPMKSDSSSLTQLLTILGVFEC